MHSQEKLNNILFPQMERIWTQIKYDQFIVCAIVPERIEKNIDIYLDRIAIIINASVLKENLFE